MGRETAIISDSEKSELINVTTVSSCPIKFKIVNKGAFMIRSDKLMQDSWVCFFEGHAILILRILSSNVIWF